MARALVKDSAAETDLIGIWVYTCETWGEVQADRYLDALESGIQGLAENPERGTCRDALRADYWSKRVEHHFAYDTFTTEEVRLRRVLHEAMEPGSHR